MTIKELIDKLSEYPDDLELQDIKIPLSVNKKNGISGIESVYLADHRIIGPHPWGLLTHMDARTNLQDVASAVLNGLKLKDHYKKYLK